MRVHLGDCDAENVTLVLLCLGVWECRGSVAMAAAYALHLNLWSHMHWEPSHIITGLQAAAPCLSMEAALLLISNSLSLPVNSRHKAAAAPQLSSSGGGLPVGAMQDAVDAVYLHNMRYSLIGAAVGVRRWLLEAGAQLSDDLLARGVLLGCSTAWLTSRWALQRHLGWMACVCVVVLTRISTTPSDWCLAFNPQHNKCRHQRLVVPALVA